MVTAQPYRDRKADTIPNTTAKVTTKETVHITNAQDRYRGGPTRTGSDPSSPPDLLQIVTAAPERTTIANRNRRKVPPQGPKFNRKETPQKECVARSSQNQIAIASNGNSQL